MNLVLLPGNSSRNEQWIAKVADGFSEVFSKQIVVKYDHWVDTKADLIDFDTELKKLEKMVLSISDYGVFAKSAGTILALLAVKGGFFKPKFCIFVGSAVKFARRAGYSFQHLLQEVKVPILFIQKAQDPAFPFASLKRLVEDSEIEGATFREISGSNHHYGDIGLLADFVDDFLIQDILS